MNISVIVPFYNEEGNVAFVIEEAMGVLEGLGRSYEIWAIDDGSDDQTPVILRQLALRFTALKILTNAPNRGQSFSLWRGLTCAQGEVMVLIDGDGQNDFHDVPAMLTLLDGADAVFGQRLKRHDPLSKRVATGLGYFFRRVMLGDTVRDTACGLKVMKRETFKYLIPIDRVHQWIPFMLSQAKVPFKTYETHHRPRTKGISKYSLRKLYFLCSIGDILFMWWFKQRNLYKHDHRPA